MCFSQRSNYKRAAPQFQATEFISRTCFMRIHSLPRLRARAYTIHSSASAGSISLPKSSTMKWPQSPAAGSSGRSTKPSARSGLSVDVSLQSLQAV